MVASVTEQIRTYARIDGDHEQTVFVHVTNDGYVRMKASNLDGVLRQLGFRDTKEFTT